MSPIAANGAGAPGDAANAVLQDLVYAVEHPPTGPAPDPAVSAAFSLGWQMAELYRPDMTVVAPAATGDLPSLRRLDAAQRAVIAVNQINTALFKLAPAIKAAGLAVPDAAGIAGRFPAGQSEADREGAVLALHVEILSLLTAADVRLGKGYGLGRALADTCRQSVSWPAAIKEFAPDRVARIRSWIDDLASALPAHAGHSVSASLRQWGDYMQAHAADQAAAGAALPSLARQGELWRALLSGEKSGPDMLEVPHYLDAAGRLLDTARGLVTHYASRFKLLIAGAVFLFLGGIALMLAIGSSAAIVAGAGGILASVGLTWKGVGGTVGGLGAKLEHQVWEAEIDTAITDAITMLPTAAGVSAAPPIDQASPVAASAEQDAAPPLPVAAPSGS